MDLKSIAEAYQSVYEKKLDPVGKEDGDVDNDGDKDSSDSYLMKRRKAIAKAMKKEETEVAEHHQKDANGKVIEHDDTDTTPSSVEEEKTVLSKLTENGEELDMFDAVVAYLIDEGFAKTLEEAQKIMSGLKPELVEEVYQSQLEKIQKSTPSENDEVQQMDEFVGAALGALNTANKVANVVNTVSAISDKMKKKKKEDNVEEMARVLVPKDGANVRRAPKPDPKPSPAPKPSPSPKPDTAPEPEKKPESPRTGKPKPPVPAPVPPKKPTKPVPRPL
jgi:hypothetical protein